MFDEQLDDADDWREGLFEDADEDYGHRCPECYAVVEGVPRLVAG